LKDFELFDWIQGYYSQGHHNTKRNRPTSQERDDTS